MVDFAGKVAIITGGTAGIGLQCSKEMLCCGLKVRKTNRYTYIGIILYKSGLNVNLKKRVKARCK